MKPLSEVAPGILVIQIQIQAVCIFMIFLIFSDIQATLLAWCFEPKKSGIAATKSTRTKINIADLEIHRLA